MEPGLPASASVEPDGIVQVPRTPGAGDMGLPPLSLPTCGRALGSASGRPVRTDSIASDASGSRTTSVRDRAISMDPSEGLLTPSGGTVAMPMSVSSKAGAAQHTEFSRTLAALTMRAADRAADELIQQLKNDCLQQAELGRSQIDIDLPLVGNNKRSHEMVAKAFEANLRELGFAQVEWWCGQGLGWRETPGKVPLIHDSMYGKYSMRVRIRWDSTSASAQLATALRELAVQQNSGKAVQENLMDLLQQAQHNLALQEQFVAKSSALLADVELRAARAETRAAQMERYLATCVGNG